MDVEKTIAALVDEIKTKKELSGLADSVVIEEIGNYLAKNKINVKSLGKFSDKEIKLIIKDVRTKLRLLHGRFQSPKNEKKRIRLIEEKNIKELLESHLSTKERLPFYEKIREIIKSLNVKTILDLGCGLNPIALASQKEIYYAADINESEISMINRYFSLNSIKGKAFIYDIRKMDEKSLPKSEVCLVLKVLDILGDNKYEIAESILKNVDCKNFLVSFSTKKLSGKNMNKPKREWFERILKKLKYDFKIIEMSNEIFYLIKKG